MFTSLIDSTATPKGLPSAKAHVHHSSARTRRHRRRFDRSSRLGIAA